jgi:hypothetical protein
MLILGDLSARAIAHLALHVALPLAVAGLFRRRPFWPTAALLFAGMVIDVDHVLATPMFDQNRCSIGFHPWHSLPAMALYAVMLAAPRLRVLAIGVWLHLALDGLDCVLRSGLGLG